MSFENITISANMLYTVSSVLVLFALYHLISAKYPNFFSQFFKPPSKMGNTPQLNSFSVDFTAMAKLGKIDPVIGRHDEIIRLAQVLSRREKNNAIIVGPPGVGKTAIVEALAQRIVSGEVPETLKGKRVLSLDIASLLSGTKYRGEFEQRAKRIVQEIISSNRSIILFIDEIHSIIQSQGTEGSVNFTDILKPALARGDLQMIGATTWMEYEKYIKTDAALERRFQPIQVDQPTEEDAIHILQGVKEKYREYHKVEFTDAALEAAVRFTSKKIINRTLPDKAIDAIDEAASMVRVSHIDQHIPAILYDAVAKKDPTIKKIWDKIQATDRAIMKASSEKERSSYVSEREKFEDELKGRGILTVDVGDIEKVIEEWLEATTM